MSTNFRSYDLAVSFYRAAKATSLPYYLKNQLLRASSSVALNLREGASKKSIPDRRRFFRIAFASLKECQSIFDLEPSQSLEQKADVLGAHIYRLIKSLER